MSASVRRSQIVFFITMLKILRLIQNQILIASILIGSFPQTTFADIDLPDELKLHLVKFLDVGSILTLRLTSTTWDSLIEDESVKKIFRDAIIQSNQEKFRQNQNGIGAGAFGTCGINQNHKVQCEGLRARYHEKTFRTIPSNLGQVRSLSFRSKHVCVVTSDHSAKCWGDNTFKQSDVPAYLNRNTKEISAGWQHTCALDLKGKPSCWANERLLRKMTPPTEIDSLIGISAGSDHTCGFDHQGVAYCWGEAIPDSLIQPPSDLGPVIAISVGYRDTCAIIKGGTLRCWGVNENHEIDFPSDLKNVNAVSVGKHHSCVIYNGGRVLCRGNERHGALAVPREIQGRARAITVGWGHTCAVRDDGETQCWGDLQFGQAQAPSPLRVQGKILSPEKILSKKQDRRDDAESPVAKNSWYQWIFDQINLLR